MISMLNVPKGKRDGKQMVQAVIFSNVPPEALPTNGNGISGLTENDCFAPLSLLIVTNDDVLDNGDYQLYISDKNGVFKPYEASKKEVE